MIFFVFNIFLFFQLKHFLQILFNYGHFLINKFRKSNILLIQFFIYPLKIELLEESKNSIFFYLRMFVYLFVC